MSEDNDIPEVTDAQKRLGPAVNSDSRDLSARERGHTARRADISGTVNHPPSDDVDQDALINALHISPDAGPYAEALERILRRIPGGWGRWISHDAGWYPIATTLDDRLAAIDPTMSSIMSKRSSAPCATTAHPALTLAANCERRSITSSAKPNAGPPSPASAAVNPACCTGATTGVKRCAHHARKRSAAARCLASSGTGSSPVRLIHRIIMRRVVMLMAQCGTH